MGTGQARVIGGLNTLSETARRQVPWNHAQTSLLMP